uniref:cytochrome-c peroxidase n=1 Tax=Kuenenia stuttgartiensis TaxID=174633 RepID=UPI001B8BD719
TQNLIWRILGAGVPGDLKEQAKGPIANPMEMASSHDLAVEVLQSIPEYVKWFKEVYGEEGITIDTVADAIAGI